MKVQKTAVLLTALLLVMGFWILLYAGQTQEPAPSEETLRACEQHQDCVEVQQTCCPCSSGGRNFSIHRRYVRFYEGFLKENCPKKNFCTKVYRCQRNMESRCENRQCVLVKKSAHSAFLWIGDEN